MLARPGPCSTRPSRRWADQPISIFRTSARKAATYSFYHGRPNSLGIVFWRFYKFPDKDRIELTKQRDVIYVYNGDKGYEITYKGPRPADPKDLTEYLRRRHFSLDWVLRKWLSEPGVALFYEGQTVAEGKTVDQVTVMNAHNEGVTLYLDIDDHLPVKKTFSWRDPTDKQRNIEDEVYDNYRDDARHPDSLHRDPVLQRRHVRTALPDRGQLQPGNQRFPVRSLGGSCSETALIRGHNEPESPQL